MNIGSTHATGGKIETEALSVVAVQITPVSAQTMNDVNKLVRETSGSPNHVEYSKCP